MPFDTFNFVKHQHERPAITSKYGGHAFGFSGIITHVAERFGFDSRVLDISISLAHSSIG